MEVVPGGVVLVAGGVVDVAGVVVDVAGVVVDVAGVVVDVAGVVVDVAGVVVDVAGVVVEVVVVVAVVVVGLVLLVVLVDFELVVAFGWLGVVVVAGSWQSWAASWPTVIAPWWRLRRNVGLTEGGRSATSLLKLVIAVWAGMHWRALTAEETAASCALRLEDSAPVSRRESPPQAATRKDTAKPSPPAENARSAVRIRGLTLETRLAALRFGGPSAEGFVAALCRRGPRRAPLILVDRLVTGGPERS